MESKDRIDNILVRKKFFASRQKAKYAIQNKTVYVNNILIEKSSKLVGIEDEIEIKGETLPFVSRGGLKLEKAIKEFQINLYNKTCMDIGASTGGFTDCMLQNKAKKVYAIDVGHDQLSEKLKSDERVINIEGTNIKDIEIQNFGAIDFIGTDVSFISIVHVLPKIYELLKIKGTAIVLIKPQFEAGKVNINKNGVVKDIKIHKKIINNIIVIANKIGFKILELTYSPIKGPAGNIEYLMYIEKNEDNLLNTYEIKNKIETIVEKAYKALK